MRSLKRAMPWILPLTFLCLGTLAVADGPELQVNPDSLFFRQMGTTAPAPARVAVSAKGGALGAFTVATATGSGGNWLAVSPTSGSGPGTLTVSVNTANLAAGEYSGKITITATGFREPKIVKVELRIMGMTDGGPGPGTPVSALIVRPNELEFHAVEGGPAPKARSVAVSNPAGSNFNWTAAAGVSTPAGGKWLKVSPAQGTGNGVLQVEVDPAGLAQGEYKGQVTVTSGNNTAKVNVELEIEGSRPARLNVHPRALNFIVEPNATKPPEPKKLEVENEGGGSLSWTASASVNTPSGGKWLSITPTSGSGEGNITVKVDPTGLAAGMYSGKVTVTSGSDSVDVQVFLRLLGPSKPRVQVRPKALKFTVTGGTVSPASRDVTVESKASGLSFTAKATTSKGGNWLKIAPASGSVPGKITASVDSAVAGVLAPGVYTGSIEVKVAGAAQEVHNVHVALKVFGAGEAPRLELEPGGLAFTATRGGANPAPRKVRLEAEGASSIAWAATVSVASPAGGNWLSVAPTSGTATASTPGEVNVSVNIANLQAGIYSGSVVFAPAAASGAPPVTLRVKLVVMASATPSKAGEVSFAEFATGPLVAFFTAPSDGFISQRNLPLNVGVIVLDSAGAPVEGATVVVDSSNTEPNLVLTDVGGGEYTAVFRPLSSGPLTLAGSAQLDTLAAPRFAVSGDMEAAAETATVIFQDGAVSAASFAASPTPLAPGSLLSLFGQALAGNGGSASTVPLPTSLSGVSVTVGGFGAPLLAAVPGASDQINLQLPFELNGVAQAEVLVNNNGVLGAPETIAIAAAVPALFTLSQSGTGSGAILHSNFSAVNAGNPVVAGEVILLYATGLGAVQPAVNSGEAAPGLATVAGNVQVTIGGLPAPLQFAGLAPGFVGLYQINVVVPAGVGSGDAQVVLAVEGIPSTGRATVAVR